MKKGVSPANSIPAEGFFYLDAAHAEKQESGQLPSQTSKRCDQKEQK